MLLNYLINLNLTFDFKDCQLLFYRDLSNDFHLLISNCSIFTINKYFYSTSPKKYKNKKDISKNLITYLAGLIEGDGSFQTPKTKLNRIASIQVAFALKDKPLALLLSSIFGGRVYHSKTKNLVRWYIQDRKSVINIALLINGYLRTPKINAFYRMVDFLNLKGAQITKLSLDNSCIGSNAWLAGFIDSDGHFSIKGFTSNPKTYLAVQFYLIQRALDLSGESLEYIMLFIAKFLLSDLKHRVISGKYNSYYLNISNKNNLKILIDYLNTYPLLSSKYLDFKNWEYTYNVYVKKLHKDPVQFELIRNIKAGMNNNRINFTWDHHKESTYGLDKNILK
jgi:LAGLIDADG endonuclease